MKIRIRYSIELEDGRELSLNVLVPDATEALGRENFDAHRTARAALRTVLRQARYISRFGPPGQGEEPAKWLERVAS